MTFLLLITSSFVASLLLTLLIRRYAEQQKLLDYPNARSSHSLPTPRGGGLAIAVVTLFGIATLVAIGFVRIETGLAMGGGGALISLIGWIDDRRTLRAWPRFMVQVVAALWATYWLGGMPEMHFGGSTIAFGPAGYLVAVISIVALTNLYNFMDGIDGLAGGQAVVVGAFAGWFLALTGEFGLALVALLICGAAGGFLLWNWPPARIFMGDVGSGLLGFLFAALAIASENKDAVPALAFVLLLATFIFDTTVTLLRRVARHEDWYHAHRSHAYQRAVQAGYSHRDVTLVMLGVAAVLGAITWVGIKQPSLLLIAVIAAAIVLGALYALVERARPMSKAYDLP